MKESSKRTEEGKRDRKKDMTAKFNLPRSSFLSESRSVEHMGMWGKGVEKDKVIVLQQGREKQREIQ